MNDPAIQRQLQQTQAAAQMQVEISVLLVLRYDKILEFLLSL